MITKEFKEVVVFKTDKNMFTAPMMFSGIGMYPPSVVVIEAPIPLLVLIVTVGATP